MSETRDQSERFRVLVVGGGVAALESVIALRQLAADRVQITLLAPEEQFVVRHSAVSAAFGTTAQRSYPLERIAAELSVTHLADRFKWIDSGNHQVHTGGGAQLTYDALILAMGARQRPRFHHALTLDTARMADQLKGLLDAIDRGLVRSTAFIVPSQPSWPLPIYELALLTAERAAHHGVDLKITLVTPEDAPLAVLGEAASRAIAQLLEDQHIEVLSAQHCQVHEPGFVTLHPSTTELRVDGVVALPELYGPSTPGIPTTALRGFLSVDRHCAVRGIPRVYAAGDATDRPIKHGSIAAQQADAAAGAIAHLAGAPIDPVPVQEFMHALLLSSEQPVFIRAQLAGDHGALSEVSRTPLWQPPNKLHAHYLSPFLDELDRNGAASA